MYYHTLQWRHNGRDGASNHQLHYCLLNRLFRRRSKKTSKLRVTGLCVNSPHKWPVARKQFPFHDVIMIITKHRPLVLWSYFILPHYIEIMIMHWYKCIAKFNVKRSFKKCINWHLYTSAAVSLTHCVTQNSQRKSTWPTVLVTYEFTYWWCRFYSKTVWPFQALLE